MVAVFKKLRNRPILVPIIPKDGKKTSKRRFRFVFKLKPRRRRYFYRRRNRLRIKLRPVRARLGPYFQAFGWERIYAAIIKLHKQVGFVARRRPLLRQSLTRDEVFYLPYTTPTTALTFQLTPKKPKQHKTIKYDECTRQTRWPKWVKKVSMPTVRQNVARPKISGLRSGALKAWLQARAVNRLINKRPTRLTFGSAKRKKVLSLTAFMQFMQIFKLRYISSRGLTKSRWKKKVHKAFIKHFTKIPRALFIQHLALTRRRFSHVLENKGNETQFKLTHKRLQGKFKLHFYKKPWINKWLQYYTRSGNNPKISTLFKQSLTSLKYMQFFANLFVINKLFNLTFRAKLGFKLKRLWSRGSLQEYASIFKKVKNSSKPYIWAIRLINDYVSGQAQAGLGNTRLIDKLTTGLGAVVYRGTGFRKWLYNYGGDQVTWAETFKRFIRYSKKRRRRGFKTFR